MIVEIPFVPVQYPIGVDLNNLKRIIQTYKEGFEKLEIAENVQLNLWCRGSSGSIIATAFALAIKNESRICHVKKPGESAHCTYPYYYSDGIDIIIDDFIKSGATIRTIYNHIVSENRKPSILIVATGAEDLNLSFDHIISNYSE